MSSSFITIRIAIVDDHLILAQGLEKLLSQHTGIEVVGCYASIEALCAVLDKNSIHVILMDISLPTISGIEGVKIIKERYPQIKIIMLTMHSGQNYLTMSLVAGADGYILKNADMSEIQKGIQSVLNGTLYIDSHIEYNSSKQKIMYNKTGISSLGSREREIIKLLCQGFTTPEIAEILILSAHTIKTHRKNILSKLNLDSTVKLVSFAKENGLDL